MRISTVLGAIVTVALAGCGRSTDKPDAAAAAAAPEAATAAPAAANAGAGDPCSLVADANATFEQAVTVERKTMPNDTVVCEWHSADGRICGSVTPFGARWNPVPAIKPNYEAMVKSMGAFGEVKDQPGIGEEAKIVDGGMFGVQLAFHTSDALALVASACSSGQVGPAALAQKLAREVAGKL
jgi:hypothetical protein